MPGRRAATCPSHGRFFPGTATSVTVKSLTAVTATPLPYWVLGLGHWRKTVKTRRTPHEHQSCSMSFSRLFHGLNVIHAHGEPGFRQRGHELAALPCDQRKVCRALPFKSIPPNDFGAFCMHPWASPREETAPATPPSANLSSTKDASCQVFPCPLSPVGAQTRLLGGKVAGGRTSASAR